MNSLYPLKNVFIEPPITYTRFFQVIGSPFLCKIFIIAVVIEKKMKKGSKVGGDVLVGVLR